ncbi:hypothetical protein [Vibrio furnissii]|nr:hypothetical protein [Vibrio furnissii]WJG21927.1 hypothetical protein QSU95_01770 [Vibrio furnissii]
MPRKMMDKCEGERGVRIVVWSRANMMLLSRGGVTSQSMRLMLV